MKNLSDIEYLIESAVYSESKILIDEAKEFYNSLTNYAIKLNEIEIEELRKINVQFQTNDEKKHSSRKITNMNLFHFEPMEGDCIVALSEIRIKDQTKYVYLELYENYMFADETITKHIYDKDKVDMWEKEISTKKQLYIYCNSVIVNDLPKHYATESKDKTPVTSMKVFVLLDENKNLIEDPRKVAEDKLNVSGYYNLV